MLIISVQARFLKILDFSVAMPALRHLQIYLGGSFGPSLRWLHATLDTFAPTNSIKEMLVYFDDDVDLSDEAWSWLDKRLVSAQISGRLNLFTLCLFTSAPERAQQLDFQIFFNHKIPFLASKGGCYIII
jgi:hypothetical protein